MTHYNLNLLSDEKRPCLYNKAIIKRLKNQNKLSQMANLLGFGESKLSRIRKLACSK